MDTVQKANLIDALLQCGAMSDRGSRDTVVRQLPEAIRLRIPRNAIDRVDILNIVDICLQHPQGLDSLYTAILLCEGNTPAVVEVCRLLPPSVVSPEQQQILRNLISQIPIAQNEWQRLYKASVPQRITSFMPVETLYEALAHLWKLPRQRSNNRRLIFEFIERLAVHVKQLSPEGAQALREYIDRTAPLLDHDLRERDIMCMRDEIEAEVSLEQPAQINSLLIKIVPKSITTTPQDTMQPQYQVRFALWRDKVNILPLEPDNPSTLHGDAWHPLIHVPNVSGPGFGSTPACTPHPIT